MNYELFFGFRIKYAIYFKCLNIAIANIVKYETMHFDYT